ncbi:N-formylglutamate deformylase [Aquimarina sp. MAR_2010_214]|uniref:hypothetical protein n=1 Tax=Aquimarina sp. MAR_2010_214 TaxID=1250026 RepID=UPI000C70483E|nr:hypothetical protein [Aquimarina sp. MAR_2010_214]PKV50290.1 N-formylglutamate deformylase [Aquimarina sp. MAR_2010_214]
MEKHFELTDEVFENQFTQCTLNPEIFSHEAHLRLAWIHISNHGIEKAEKKIQTQLQSFVEFVGAKDKYNKTLTIVATKAVNHFMNQSKSDSFKDFIVEFPQLKTNFKQLIGSHYSFDIFNSEKAKTEFLEPDVLAFD